MFLHAGAGWLHGIEVEPVFGLLTLLRVLVPFPAVQEEHQHGYSHEETAENGSRAVDQAARGQVELQTPPATNEEMKGYLATYKTT